MAFFFVSHRPDDGRQVAAAFRESTFFTLPASKPTHAVPKLPAGSDGLRTARAFLEERQRVRAARGPRASHASDSQQACEACVVS